MIIKILLLIIFVEALTEILVSSSIFLGPRDWIGQRNSFFGELVNCGYCTSVWVSVSIAWVAILALSGVGAVDYLITTMVLHRGSNLLHEFNSKWLNRRPLALAIHKTEAVILPEFGELNESSRESESI